MDFIGNYINVHRIVDYLTSYGGGSLDSLKEKPVYFYDNGCSVKFEEKALEIITSMSKIFFKDINMIEDFFSLINRFERIPTIAEIQSKGKYKVRDYIEYYGSWGGIYKACSKVRTKVEFERT